MTENEEPIKQSKTENVDTPEYMAVEQLDDVDFEKEKKEKRKLNKAWKIVIGVIIFLIILGIGAFVVFEVFGFGKGNVKIVVEEFVSSFNSQDFESMMNLIDLEGFYALATTSEGEEVDETTNFEKYYTKFDERYEKAKSENDCKEFVESMSNVDFESLKTIFEGIEMTISQIDDPVIIQNTKGLYKVSTTVEMTSAGESATEKYTFYVYKTKDSCKIVGGDLPESILYMMVLSEYYNTNSVVTE